VLFNRFYQPDIQPESGDLAMTLQYSDSSELLLRLRWIAILSGRIRPSLAATGGIHQPIDAVKAVMAGAHAVQMVSALLSRGPGELTRIRDGFARWGERHGYSSVAAMRGACDLSQSKDAERFERGNYQQLLSEARQTAAPWSGH
jgi:dihydroorotate dehydrogenase (fumarate)